MLLFHTLTEDLSSLAGLLDGETVTLNGFGCTVAGPSGDRGHYWYIDDPDSRRVPHATYAPDKQIWRRVPGRDLWIGWETAKPPRPEFLQRGEQLASVGVKLADGNVWQIPNGMKLPYTFGRDESGHVCKRRTADIQSIYDRTVWAFGECRELVATDAPITEDNAGQFGDYCGWLLSLNYRLTPPMVWALDLLNPATIWNTMAASTDFHAINRLIDALADERTIDTAGNDDQPAPFDAGLTSAAGVAA